MCQLRAQAERFSMRHRSGEILLRLGDRAEPASRRAKEAARHYLDDPIVAAHSDLERLGTQGRRSAAIAFVQPRKAEIGEAPDRSLDMRLRPVRGERTGQDVDALGSAAGFDL